MAPFVAMLAAAVLSVEFAGQSPRAIEPYRPGRAVNGVIRLWGHGSPTNHFMARIVDGWEAGFQRHQPAVRFEDRMYGTASAIGALYTGTGDVAILGREILPSEITAFRRVKGYVPVGVDVATGSLDVRNFDFALVVFVHRDNPISQLTFTQLDGIFGCGPTRLAAARTWGSVGAAGAWSGRPIRAYGSRLSGGFSIFFQSRVMQGRARWNPEIQEFFDVRQPDGSLLDSGQQVVDAVGRDPDGIGIASLLYKNPNVKALAVAPDDQHPAYPATRQTLIDRTYPLTRVIPAYIDRAPGAPANTLVNEFLRYLLSADGQQVIVEDGRYLPLGASAVAEQLKKLN